jgi:hypothetical protein
MVLTWPILAMAEILSGFAFDATLGDDVTQELSLGDPEGAFFLV